MRPEDIAGTLRQLGVDPGPDPLATLRAMAAEVKRLRADAGPARQAELRGELERLRPLADLGREFRTKLIDQALEAGRRAFEHFDTKAQRALLEKQDRYSIVQFRDAWSTIAAARGSTNGVSRGVAT